MASQAETRAVYGAGLVQGVALVAFPASSAILTSPQYYDLSSTAYGALFLPQAAAAILAALSGSALMRRIGIKRTYLAGLVGDLVAMSLLVASQFFIGQGSIPYVMLLLATTSLGVGFGLTVPAINTFAAAFAPAAAARAVLYLNALLGLGTALAPVLVAVFVGIGFWWGLPLVTALLIAGLIAFSLRLPLEVAGQSVAGGSRAGLPSRFWLFAAFALLYGVVETTNGNWSTIYMTSDLGSSATLASIALTTFWAMVTVGRILFAAIERRFPETRTYRLLPFVAAAALVVIAALPDGDSAAGVLRIRTGGARLLGAPAVDDQLRPGRAGGHRRDRGRLADRLLPDGLRAGRVRGRTAGGAVRRATADHLSRGSRRRRGDGGAVVRRRPRVAPGDRLNRQPA